MAMTHTQHIGSALELLRQGLAPFIQQELRQKYGNHATREAQKFLSPDDWRNSTRPISQWDCAALLKLLTDARHGVFGFERVERSLAEEMRRWRNAWAHQDPMSIDDVDRALDTAARLLQAISAPQATEVEQMKRDLWRTVSGDGGKNSAAVFVGYLRDLNPQIVRGGGVSLVLEQELDRPQVRGIGRVYQPDLARVFHSGDRVRYLVEGPPDNFITILEFEVDNNGACILGVPSDPVTGGQSVQLPQATPPNIQFSKFPDSRSDFVQMVLPINRPATMSLPPSVLATRMFTVAIFTSKPLIILDGGLGEITLDEAALGEMISRVRSMKSRICYWNIFEYNLREGQGS